MEDDKLNIFETHYNNLNKAIQQQNYQPEKYVMGKTLDAVDTELNDEHYEIQHNENDKNKINGISSLNIKGMTDEEYNMYKFANGLDNYSLFTPDDEKNYKVSSAWNWFGAGADSKVTTNGIIKRINKYIDNLYNSAEGLSDGNVQVEVSDWWLRGLTNGSNRFINGNNGIVSVTEGNDITLYKGDTKLFTFRGLGKDDFTPNDKGNIIFYPDDKTTAYLLFSELYNNIASDKYMQKFIRNGADDGMFTKQFGDEFEETGDMMTNVKSYVRSNVSYYRDKKDKVYLPGEQYYYTRNDGSLISGLGLRGHADISLKVMDGYFQAAKANGAIKHFEDYNEAKYMADWATAMGNIGNLYIESEGGDEFDPTKNQATTMDILQDSAKRRLIMQDIHTNFSDCQFVLTRHGLHWGYEITVPASEDKMLWGVKDGKGLGNYTYKVFVEGALDTDVINELKSRPENMAHDAIVDAILNNSPYEYTSVDVLHNTNIDTENKKYTADETGSYGGAFNAYYNQNTGNMQFSWHANDGNYYDLNTIFENSKNANIALQQYLTIVNNIHNYKDVLYSTSTSNRIEEHIIASKMYSAKDSSTNEGSMGAIMDYLAQIGDSGYTNGQILAIFANPSAATAIMHAHGSNIGKLLMLETMNNVYESIMKYNQNYDIKDFNEWSKNFNAVQ